MTRYYCALWLVGLGITLAAPAMGAAAPGPAPTQAEKAAQAPALSTRLEDGLAAMDKAEHYKSADSGILGWGESYVLTAYYWRWEATKDTAWLDRIVKHADAIFANLSPGDETQPGWRTPRYSVAIAEAEAASGNQSGVEIMPPLERVFDLGPAAKVTGHTYELLVRQDDAIQVMDTTTGNQVAASKLPANGRIADIPGLLFMLNGVPKPGDRFIVKTQAPKPFEYVVHDGMVLTPIAQFCAAVLADARLKAKYGAAAQRYLELIETKLLPKWDRYWRDLPEGAGAYTAQNDPAQRFPGATLPHNQCLALGRTYIAVYRITGKPAYRERIERMARFFKSKLRLVDGRYEWNYWDYAGPWDEQAKRMAHLEDSSHGAIDVGFAVDAFDAGLGFDRQDLDRFAATVSEAMWNGSDTMPRVGSRVDSSGGEEIHALEWVRLGRFSEKTRKIMTGMVESVKELRGVDTAAAAQLLALQGDGWKALPRYIALRPPRPAPKSQ